jgi:hypothetical protein
MTLESLPLARLHFDLSALDEAELPAYKGDMLRMALLWWLSEYWCLMPQRCRQGCTRPDACLFGQLVEPRPDPAWSPDVLRLVGDTPPPAYALWDCQDRRRHLAEGTRWDFELTLAGERALRQIPAIVAAVQQGAELGMGRQRLRSRLWRVASLVEGAEGVVERVLAVEKPSPDGPVLTWENFGLADVSQGYAQAIAWAETWEGPVRAFSLRYLSPVKIREHKQWVGSPHFGAVMRAVVRRLRLLSAVHGAGQWPHHAWGPLLDLAETVQLEHDETLWGGYTRSSDRSGEHDVEGFVGQAWYAGEDDLRPLLPALWLSQWLHIGKEYVLGSGRYRVERVAS